MLGIDPHLGTEGMKQRAWKAAVAAVGKVRAEASDREMETAVAQAVQPISREYEHQQGCQRIVGRIYMFDATREEEEAAREALAARPSVLKRSSWRRPRKPWSHLPVPSFRASAEGFSPTLSPDPWDLSL